MPQRAYSTKRRIKTFLRGWCQPLHYSLKEHIPLKEGLRLYLDSEHLKTQIVLKEHIPLKEGLRLYLDSEHLKTQIVLKEHIPLKEGLRLVYWFAGKPNDG